MIYLFRGPSGANSVPYNNKEIEPLHIKITTRVGLEKILPTDNPANRRGDR